MFFRILALVFAVSPEFQETEFSVPRSLDCLLSRKGATFASSFEQLRFVVPELGLIINPPGFADSNGEFVFTDSSVAKLRKAKEVYVDFTQNGISTLVNLQGSSSVHVLDLSGTEIGDEQIDMIVSLVELRVLDLSDTRVTGKSLKRLSELSQLRTLSISGTDIQTTDIELFLRRSKTIQFLFCNDMKSEFVELSIVSETLRVLDVSFNSPLHLNIRRAPRAERIFVSGVNESKIVVDELQNPQSLKLIKIGPSNSVNGRHVQIDTASYLKLAEDWIPTRPEQK